MKAPALEELDNLKYFELQKLAKTAGLKANLKADRLLRTLKKHFHPAFIAENSSSDSDGNSTLTDDTQGKSDEEEAISLCHVTHRRGRGKKEIRCDSSPEIVDKNKATEGGDAENAGKETSVPVSPSVLPTQQSTEDDTREKTVHAAERTTRRRSKRKSSSVKKLGGKIPKNAGVSKSGSKPSTPNFKRLHEAHFKKMESIDKFLERKQKRLEAITSSIQEVKIVTKSSEKVSQKKTPGSNRVSQKKTPGSNRVSQKKTPGSNNKKLLRNALSLQSPLLQTGNFISAKTPANQRSTSKRSILVDKSGVKPSTFSSSKLNVRFSGATKDNEHKYSLVKTPARKSSTFVPIINSEPRKSLPLSKIKASLGTEDTNIPEATTPFKFSAPNMTTPNTSKKMKFDLQASLARPLAYQPHRGKLKPWGESKENDDVQSKLLMLKDTYKQPILSTRAERRQRHHKEQKSKRDQTLGSRRGVSVS